MRHDSAPALRAKGCPRLGLSGAELGLLVLASCVGSGLTLFLFRSQLDVRYLAVALVAIALSGCGSVSDWERPYWETSPAIVVGTED